MEASYKTHHEFYTVFTFSVCFLSFLGIEYRPTKRELTVLTTFLRTTRGRTHSNAKQTFMCETLEV